MSLIPRVLFQTWKTHLVPSHLQPFYDSWSQKHPHWQQILFSDEENDGFVHTFFPLFEPCYRALPHKIQQVDAVRYMWLYQHGGIYADLDMQCLQSLEPLLQQEEERHSAVVILGEENEKHKDGTSRVGNAIMISSRGHPFWLAVLQEIQRRTKNVSHPQDVTVAWNTTGPHMLHEVYQQWLRDRTIPPVIVLSSEFFYPKQWEAQPQWGLVRASEFPHSFTIHHWAGTWWNPKGTVNQKATTWQKTFLWLFVWMFIGISVIFCVRCRSL